MSPRVSYPRPRYRTGLALALVTVAAACGPSIDVRTMSAPEAVTLSHRRTFAVVESRSDTTGAPAYGINDPMVANPITSQAVHDQIKAAFEARGYRYSTEHPDFIVTYEATIAPILDIWSDGYGAGYYGYRSWYGSPGYYGDYWADPYGYGHAVGAYERSTVILDVIDPGTGKMLWRGQGTSDGYTDPKHYIRELGHAVHAVSKKFPPAGSPIMAWR